MDDEKIIELYWRRDETAITRTDEKYGRLARAEWEEYSALPPDTKPAFMLYLPDGVSDEDIDAALDRVNYSVINK